MRLPRKTLRFLLFSFLGLVGIIVTLYLMLAFGWLGSFPDSLATKLSSIGITTVRFYGIHSNLFWSTRADSVIVTDTDGLHITIAQPDIQGNVLDFLFNRHLNRLSVEKLLIDVSTPSRENELPPSLTEILENIDLGIVTGADSLILIYGAVSDTSGILVDSMYLRTSLTREDGVMLEISAIGVFIPGFGGINGYGSLGMENNVVSSSGIHAIAVPGSLFVTGSLAGEGAVPDIDFSGAISTEFLNLPVSISTDIDGRIFGTLSKPETSLSFSDASADVFDCAATVSADSIYAGLDSVAITNFQILNEELSLLCSGTYRFSSMEWGVSLDIAASDLDVSRYYSDIPETAITGSISLNAEGSELLVPRGSADLNLSNSEISGIAFESFQADVLLDSGQVEYKGNIAAFDGSCSFSAISEISSDMALSDPSAEVSVRLYSPQLIELLGVSGIPDFSSVYIRVSAEGMPPDMSIDGSVEIDEIDFGGTSIDSAELSGYCNLSDSGIRADCSLSLDSLRVSSAAYSISADASLRDSRITVENMAAVNTVDRMTIGTFSMTLGPVSQFYTNDISATHSKLRIITQGSASGYLSGSRLRIDTLWIHPPVGYLGLSGTIGPGSDIDIDATLHQFDFAALATLLALPVNLSGVGNFDLSIQDSGSGINGYIKGTVDNPEYGRFTMDSLSMDVTAGQDSILVNSLYCWRDSIRSEFRGSTSGYSTDGQFAFDENNIDYFYIDVANIGDWLFYVLPVPFRTLNSNVTAKAEYVKTGGTFESGLTIDASAEIETVFITALSVSFPDVTLSLNYPDTTESGYNTKFTMNAGNDDSGEFSLSTSLNVTDFLPFSLGKYSFSAEMNSFEIPIMGMGILVASGSLSSSGDAFEERPLLSGDIAIDRSILGIPEISEGSSDGGSSELPFDLSVDVSCPGDVWVRSSYANIEVAVDLNVLTLEHKPTANGTISCVRGKITLYQRELDITEGTVTFVQGDPLQIVLNIRAESRIRNIMSQEEYTVVVQVTGDAANPVIVFSGSGPDGALTTEDAMTLLSLGLTYSELQQINSTAFRTGVEGAAQSILGSYLARNLRGMLGLDTFVITPELLSDSTSLVVDAGKYVLPNLFLSYKIDVFSSEPGTASAQYMIMRNLFVEGSTRTTIHGEFEPTIELHYILRY